MLRQQLDDDGNDAVAWLQSASDSDVALPLVSPRRFVPAYRVRITKDQLTPLELAVLDHAFVLVAVSCHETGPTINLRAPIVVNLERRIGRQLVTSTVESIQQAILGESTTLRKSCERTPSQLLDARTDADVTLRTILLFPQRLTASFV